MTNTNQQEQLYRLIKELDFYGWKSTGMKENPTDVPMEDVFILRQDVIKILSKPPVEDGKQGGEVSVEDVLADIISIRNKLYEDLPTGEMNAFELLQTIKWHINELDNYCTTLSTYKSQPVNKQD